MKNKIYLLLLFFIITTVSVGQVGRSLGNFIISPEQLPDPIPDSLLSENVKVFPFDKLVTKWDGSSDVFRYMVDPILGSDANDGLTWATAKITIQSAIDELPADCENHEAWILIKPATYDGGIIIKNLNTTVFLTWIGSTITKTDICNTWLRNSETVTSTDGQIIIQNTSGTALESGAETLVISGSGLSVTLMAEDMSIYYGGAGIWSDARFYWDRWYFQAQSSSTLDFTIHINDANLYTDSGLSFKPAKQGGVTISSGASLVVRALKTVYNNTSACTSTSNWAGLFQYRWGSSSDINTIDFNYNTSFQYVPAYNIPIAGVYMYIDGASNILGSWGNSTSSKGNFNFLAASRISYSNASGGLATPIILLDTEYGGGNVKYDSGVFLLTDNSTSARNIEEYATSTIQAYLTNNLYDDGTSILMPNLPIADPGVSGALWNNAGVINVSP